MKSAAIEFTGVLLADDDPDDRFLFEDALKEIQLGVNLEMVKDGEELMHYLLASAVVLPDVLFLDLNMPFKNGVRCLEEIRGNSLLHSIFIVIYSTTASQREIDEVYEKGANLFVKKPNSFTELKDILSGVFRLDRQEYFPAAHRDRFVFRHPAG